MKSDALGVVVVRVQVPELHDGHRYLLNAVCAIHNRVLVVIGETETRLTVDDPLTYDMRRKMVLGEYPNVIVDRLRDASSDFQWSVDLDMLIARYLMVDETISHAPTLYGGRSSFIEHYRGLHRTFVLPPNRPISGTDVREAVQPEDNPSFRRGMIYASKHRYPVSYQCIDMAMVSHGKVLLAQKARDGGRWRFPGGFVDPKDATLEAAAKRELREETGLEPGDANYIASVRIEDFRFPKEGADRLLSALFLIDYVYGAPVAGDDVDEVAWFPLEEARAALVNEHVILFDLLDAFLTERTYDAQ